MANAHLRDTEILCGSSHCFVHHVHLFSINGHHYIRSSSKEPKKLDRFTRQSCRLLAFAPPIREDLACENGWIGLLGIRGDHLKNGR